jgi:phospholipid/cholesterol/gamma-HCH transport system substrate-binding protein
VAKLTDDPRFMDSIRSLAEGLGKFFDELYPAQTKAGPTPR